MSGNHIHHKENPSLADKLMESTGVSVAKCYQCGKCSAGCPMVNEMDITPSMVLRMLQNDDAKMDNEILESHSIWLCVGCEMCIGRCPQEVDLPVAMDYLRAASLKAKKVNKKAKPILKFHRAFLDSIEYTGRLYEIGLIADYKVRAKNLMQDVALAPVMFAKGKLHILPEMIKDRKNIKRIFKKTLKKEEGK